MGEVFDRLGAELHDSYRLKRELARGGAAIVYVARDVKHERNVALKVLRPDLAATLGADRFLREIKIAAQLSHPHILPVHDSGTAAGYLYYVMPLVEGDSLRQRLGREHTLSVADTISLLHDVLDALHHAHSHNVVHRDIKPDNVMLSGRHALVTDFGVAKALSVAKDPHGIDTVGVALGTPAYMSPEQVAADPTIDHRADIYSVGVLAYEMLTGRPPFLGDSPQSVLAAHVTQEPDPLIAHRVGVPRELADIVMRCLAKDPEERWQSAEDVLQQLDVAMTPTDRLTPVSTTRSVPVRRSPLQRRMVTVLGVAVAVLFLMLGWVLRGPRDPGTESRPVLVVLPFANLGSSQDEFFASGITDAVTARLAALEGLGVISRTSAVQFRGSDKPPQQIAAELGANYVLEGTIQRERPGDPTSRIRIIPQLIRVSDDTHVWASVYDEDMTEVFRLQSDIAERVAQAMDLTLLEPDRETLGARPTDNLEAYEFYLQAHEYLAGNRGSGDANARRIAIDLLDRAIELDGSFALALAELSLAHIWLFRHYVDPTDGRLALARSAADSGMALDPDLPEVHLALGHYFYWGASPDPTRALEEFRTVIRREPNNAYARTLIAGLEASRGEWDSALINASMAADLDPREPEWALNAGLLHLMARRYAASEEYLDRALALAPDLVEAHKGKIGLYLSWQGDVARARQAVADMAAQVLPGEVALAMIEIAPMLVTEGDYDDLFDGLTMSSISGPLPFDYLFTKAEFSRRRGRMEQARSYFDSLLAAVDRLPAARREGRVAQAFRARAQAGLGLRVEAIASAQRLLSRRAALPDALRSARMEQWLIWIYAMVGEEETALDHTERLLARPSFLSVHYLRVAQPPGSLDQNPRFRQLIRRGPAQPAS